MWCGEGSVGLGTQRGRVKGTYVVAAEVVNVGLGQHSVVCLIESQT